MALSMEAVNRQIVSFFRLALIFLGEVTCSNAIPFMNCLLTERKGFMLPLLLGSESLAVMLLLCAAVLPLKL